MYIFNYACMHVSNLTPTYVIYVCIFVKEKLTWLQKAFFLGTDTSAGPGQTFCPSVVAT